MANDELMPGREPGEPKQDWEDRMAREAAEKNISPDQHKLDTARRLGHDDWTPE